MNRKNLILYIAMALTMSIIVSKDSKAQDPQFTQFYANPLYLNPAFAGAVKCPRISLNYRNQWPQLAGNFVTYSASYDQHVRALSGGVGLLVTSDIAGGGVVKTNTISGIYSYQQPISRTISLKFGLQATYNQKALDWDMLQFGDQIDARSGFIYSTSEIPRGGTAKFADFSGGILAFNEKYFVGFAAHHLNEPRESLILGKSRLPIRFTAHAGMSTPLKTRRGAKDAKISPNILYQRQDEFEQINIGLYVQKGDLVFGIWHRFQESFIGSIGIHSGSMKIGYSYDMTTSKLGLDSGGSHELAISAILKCKNTSDRIIIPPCSF